VNGRTLAAGVLVLVVLALSAQLAFTDVGRQLGAHWSEPAELGAVDGDDAAVTSLAARDGAVAWIERTGDAWTVRTAQVATGGTGGTDGSGGTESGSTGDDGGTGDADPDASGLAVRDARTVATSTTELRGVGVARSGDRTVAVWERVDGDEIVLHDGDAARVVRGGESLDSPTVAVVGDRTVLAHREFAGDEFALRVAVVDGGATVAGAAAGGARSMALAPVGGAGGTDEDGSPSATAAGLAWVEPDDFDVQYARVDPDGPTVGANRSFGVARAGGGFGSAAGPGPVSLTGGRAPRVVWSDLGRIYARPADGSGPREAVASGAGPRAVATADGWLVTWLTTSRATGSDVRYARYGPAGVESAYVSRLPSNAVDAVPVRTADGSVAVVWTERRGGVRVLASAYDPSGTSSVVERATTAPGRLGFVALAAVAAGAVLVPISPWVVFPLLVGFLATTELVLGAASAVAARLLGLVGRDVDARGVRERLRALPVAVPVGLFVLSNVTVLLWLGGGGIAGVNFGGMVPISIAAVAGTGLIGLVGGIDSPWRLVVLFSYVQSVGLWATALPGVL